MSNNSGHRNLPIELTEREKKILAYRREGHSYRETCRDLRVSATEISIVEKKERGEYVPDEKENPNFQNYAEMYRLFSIGKQPLQVAIALNLPVDYVSEQYKEYLKSIRLHGFLQLYERIGDGGTRIVLLSYDSMVASGFSDKPQQVGQYLRYCQQMLNEGMNLRKIRERSSKIDQETRAAKNVLQEVNEKTSKAKKTLDDTIKAIESSKKELARINDAIAYQVRTNPFITAAQAGREAAQQVLNDNIWLIRAAQEVYLKVIHTNTYVRWLYIPETRPEAFDRFPEKTILAYCQSAIEQAANEYFYRVLKEAMIRASSLHRRLA